MSSGGAPRSDEDSGKRTGVCVRQFLVLAAIAALLVATSVANILWPVILRDHPLLLPALDGRNRYLLLSSAKIGTVPLVIVGVGRRLAGHVAYYLLGRWYGKAALRWATRRSRLWRRVVTRHPQLLGRIAEAAVLVSSSNIARTLAGATGMSMARFATLEIVGTTVQMVALLVFVRSMGERVPRAVGMLDGHALGLAILLVSLCLGWLAWRAARRHRRRASTARHRPGGALSLKSAPRKESDLGVYGRSSAPHGERGGWPHPVRSTRTETPVEVAVNRRNAT